MKKIIISFLDHLKSAFWINATNRRLLILTVGFSGLDYYLWQKYLSSSDLFFNIRIGIYPLQYMAIIILVNTFLALVSYDEESEVTYLLLIANMIIVYLITILEFCYILR